MCYILVIVVNNFLEYILDSYFEVSKYTVDIMFKRNLEYREMANKT